MTATPFRARNGFDAAGNRLRGMAGPALDSTGNAFEPLDGINWKTLREHTGLRIVTNEAARKALEQAKGELIIGDVVLDQDTGLAWRYAAAGKWEPFGRGGLTYVGRQANLPNPATDVISNGQMFVVRMDFGGKDLYRVAAWDDTIPSSAAFDPMLITDVEVLGAPVLGQPTVATLTLGGMPGVSNAEADVVIRLATMANGSHLFLYRIQPGEDLTHVVRMLAATYNAAPHDPAVSAVANGSQLILTGSPGSPALPGRTVQGGTFVGEITAAAQIQTFLSGSGRQPGDFVVNTAMGIITAPDGQVIPSDTALIIESLSPLLYHVADAPTPLPPIGNGVQVGTGTMTTGAQQNSFIAWLNSSPASGDFYLNVGTQTLVGGGFTLRPNFAVVQTPAGFREATVATPATQAMQGGIIMEPTALPNVITSQAEFTAMCLDPTNHREGAWWNNTTGQTFQLFHTPENPTAPPTANVSVAPGVWIFWTASFGTQGGAWDARTGGPLFPPGQDIGGTPIPNRFNPPNPAPEATYPMAQQPPAQPTATLVAQAQIDPTQFIQFRAAVANRGPTATPPGGGWRWLNREIWDKSLRSDRDQQTDQRAGDLQVTRENAHQELKAWNSTSGQWDMIYSRDQINAAIAAMSLFEGTINEVGGGAVGALELDALPDLAARTAAKDLSEVSHYWTWIGSPNYAVTAATPIIGTDLNGAILNPGDWIQIANRGGDGSGVGLAGGPPDLKWVTVGGDLLAKARADRLFGLLPWAQGGWEQGALVLFNGDVYRASQPVTASDPNPDPQLTAVNVPLSGTISNDLTGGGIDVLPANPGDGDVETTTGTGLIGTVGVPFSNHNYVVGDSFVYTSNPAFAGTGVTAEGYSFDQGWVAIGQTQPIPNPLAITAPVAATPWQRVDISGGLKVAQDDSSLPATAPPGQVWIVLQSAKANGEQALYGYDPAAGVWQQLGGDSGKPIDLSNGLIVYPKAIYVDQELSGNLQGAALPAVTLATIMTATYRSPADVAASPPDGSAGTAGEWWNFLIPTLPSSAVPGWGSEPPFTRADVLVSLGDPTLNGYTTDGRRIINGVIRGTSALSGGSRVTGNMQTSGVPSPEIAGDILVTRNQAGFPMIKAISKDGKTWSWYHPHRLTFDLLGKNKSSKADYPMQLNIGIANGQARVTHIADRNLDWVEVQQSAVQNPIGGTAGGNVQGRTMNMQDGRFYRYSGFYRTTTSSKSVFIAPLKSNGNRLLKGDVTTLFTARTDHSSNNQGGTFDVSGGGTDGWWILSGTDDAKQNNWHPFTIEFDFRSPSVWKMRIFSEYVRSGGHCETSITTVTGAPQHRPDRFYFSNWTGQTSEWQVFDDV